MREWKKYRRAGLSEMRPYMEGEDVSHVSISEADRANGSPKAGDMIARHPKNHADQWLVARQYFRDNLVEITDHIVLPLDPSLIDDAAVEVMARAMFNADMPSHEHWWPRMTEDERDMYRDGARAALTALLAHYAEGE